MTVYILEKQMDYKDLLLVFFAGLIVGWFLKEFSSSAVKQQTTLSNEESWDMWEDEEGHLHAVIHRKVKR